jgi:DNA-binding response OmpR family regulator
MSANLKKRGNNMKTILIVDDEPNIRLLYKEEFLKDGYSVLEADNGISAFNQLKNKDIDLVILDIKMPEMDGLDFLTKMRKGEHKIPVILCTAYGQHKQDLVSWAADRYIVKSGDLTELKNNVHELLPV